MLKYKLTDEKLYKYGYTLHRIEYLIDIPQYGVSVGDKGGWLENESNLDHNGTCVVLDEAKVMGNSTVTDDAMVCGNAVVSGNVSIYNSARVGDNSYVHNGVSVCGNAKVMLNSIVSNFTSITSDAVINTSDDYVTLVNIGELGSCITYTRSNSKWYDGGVTSMSTEEFIKRGYDISKKNGEAYENAVKFVNSLYNGNDYKPNAISRVLNIFGRIFLTLTIPFMIAFTFVSICVIPLLILVIGVISFLTTGDVYKIFNWEPVNRFIQYWGITFCDDGDNFLTDYVSLFTKDNDDEI